MPLSRRGLVLAAIGLGIGIPGAWLLARDKAGSSASDSPIVAHVKKGEFKVVVNTSGELRALRAVQISLPPNSQQAEVYNLKIATLVSEGTVVKAGDVVAEIDRSTLATKMAEVGLALQKAQAVYEQAMLDSTLNLSKAREDIRTMEFGVEEKKLAKEQATYEAPTIKRQAEIDFDKAERALAQAKVDYKTKTEQAQAKMREVGSDLERQKNKLALVQQVMEGFTIRAPAPGMVIYVKEWNGKKKTVGSGVSPWEPAVATLPDLTRMESTTYVNEIDVRKISVGQPAVITLDADPSKRLSGKVTSVANVGEQRPNSDAKVFEVKIEIAQSDTTLRPGMTTGNAIETAKTAASLYVPLDALASDNGIPVVYRLAGRAVVKQEVETGVMNEDEVVIARGLDADDRVLLTVPTDHDRMTVTRLPNSTARPKTPQGDTAAPNVPLTTPPAAPSSRPAKAPAAGADKRARR
jgi:RND family efflux transporter MFP subunit